MNCSKATEGDHRCKSFSEQIRRAVETLQRAASPKIHFPTCESRLDAAPTELIACFSPVTIKILLLRSMPDYKCPKLQARAFRHHARDRSNIRNRTIKERLGEAKVWISCFVN